MSTVVMRTKRVTTMRGTPRRARRHTIERASADATRGCTMWARDRPTRACTSSTRVTLRRAERERTADRVARASCADRDPYRMPRGSDTHPNARDAGRDEARRSAPGFGWCCGWCGCGGCGVHLRCACGSPERIRTAVTALRGRRPRPLDDGAGTFPPGTGSGTRDPEGPGSAGRLGRPGGRPRSTLARGGGLEPPITGPEPVVLPITPPPKVER